MCRAPQHWVVDLPNDANKKFVADFKKKYNREPVLLCGAGL